jgi:hypothetical protein
MGMKAINRVRDSLTLAGLEQELSKISGVRSVRVVGGARPSEIHVVAGRARSPKQIVRDVQSLAVAGFGVSIDHRIVSVVQLDDEAAPDAATRQNGAVPVSGRPVVESVLLNALGSAKSVRVALVWPDGGRTQGTAKAGTSRELQARAAMQATIDALTPALDASDTRVEVEHAFLQAMGADEAVVVKATVYEGNEPTPVTGAVLVEDDVVSAGVRALLHAVNRKLRPPASAPA